MPQAQSDDTRDHLPGNEPTLTPAELAIQNEVDNPEAGEGATAAPDPAAAPPEQQPAPDAAAPAPASADDGTGGDDAAATPPAAAASQGGPVAFPTLAAPEARDFKAELLELKTKLDNGDLDEDAYTDAREAIVIARAKFETQQEMAAQLAEQNWKTQVNAFLRQPENAALLRSAEIQDLWSTMMQRAVNNAALAGTPLTEDWEIMTKGRDLLYETLGLSATVEPPPAPQAAAAAPPLKAPPMDKLPPTLSGAPAAAQTGAAMAGDTLVNGTLEEAERIGHGMTEAQWDEVLAKTPGSFADD